MQEIGRAGRDGRPAIARAMVLRQDVVEQISLSHTGGVARSQIEEFLAVAAEAARDVIGDVPEAVREGMIFSELKVSIPVLKSVNRCDLRAETVETLLSLMEEEEFGSLLELEGGLADVCVVILKRRKLEELAKTEPVAACILRVGTLVSGADANARLEEEGGTAMEKGFHAYALGNYSFSVVRVANAMGSGCEPRNVYAALRRLEVRGELETLLDTGVRGKGFGVKLNKRGVEVFRSGRMEEVADKLVERMEAKEGKAEGKVKEVWSIMYRMFKLNKGDKDSRVRLFKHAVRGYFEGILVDAESEKLLSTVNVPNVCKTSLSDADLRRCASDVSKLRHDSRLSAESFVAGALIADSSRDYGARAVANLLHGIDLPRQSMSLWWNDSFWGSWKDFDYSLVLKHCQTAFAV